MPVRLHLQQQQRAEWLATECGECEEHAGKNAGQQQGVCGSACKIPAELHRECQYNAEKCKEALFRRPSVFPAAAVSKPMHLGEHVRTLSRNQLDTQPHVREGTGLYAAM